MCCHCAVPTQSSLLRSKHDMIGVYVCQCQWVCAELQLLQLCVIFRDQSVNQPQWGVGQSCRLNHRCPTLIQNACWCAQTLGLSHVTFTMNNPWVCQTTSSWLWIKLLKCRSLKLCFLWVSIIFLWNISSISVSCYSSNDKMNQLFCVNLIQKAWSTPRLTNQCSN